MLLIANKNAFYRFCKKWDCTDLFQDLVFMTILWLNPRRQIVLYTVYHKSEKDFDTVNVHLPLPPPPRHPLIALKESIQGLDSGLEVE